jgi:hypothetical protein
MCNDTRCTAGITWCAECHGHGALNPKGKRYRIKCKALPEWAVPHDDCAGTGLRECGCTPLGVAERAVLTGRVLAAA